MNREFKIAFSMIAGVIVVVAFISVLSPRDKSLIKIKEGGVIRIGYAVEAPYVFLNSDGGVTGAEAEMAKVIVARLGIQRIDWRLYEFNRLIPELEEGRIDVIVAGLFITPERAQRVSFSEPTFHVQQGMLVAKGNPKQLYSYTQVAMLPQIKIAVISGAVEGTILKQLGIQDAQLIQVPDALTGRKAVETGIVDAFALSDVSIHWMAAQDQLGRTEIADPFEQMETGQNFYVGYGGVVFRQGDEQLRAAWNAELKPFLGTPEHLDLVAKFGFTSHEVPGDVTTEEIISQP